MRRKREPQAATTTSPSRTVRLAAPHGSRLPEQEGIASSAIECGCFLLHCISSLMAHRVTQHFGGFRGEADMDVQAKPAGSVENDPSATSGAQICCGAQRGFSSSGVVW